MMEWQCRGIEQGHLPTLDELPPPRLLCMGEIKFYVFEVLYFRNPRCSRFLCTLSVTKAMGPVALHLHLLVDFLSL